MPCFVFAPFVSLSMFGSGFAVADTLSVGTSGQYSTIQEAIDAASSGDTIEVDAGT